MKEWKHRIGNLRSDNLIGKSGTNTIQGFENNDHIEGRGDIDLLISGAQDDEVFEVMFKLSNS